MSEQNKALEFYSSGYQMNHRDHDVVIDDFGNEDHIVGKTARDALKEIEGMK